MGSVSCNGRYCITAGNRARKMGAAGTGNKVAPDSALLRPGATLFLRRPEIARNGHGRSGPERCARDRSAYGFVGRVQPRPPVARPGAAMKVSPHAMAATSRPCAQRSRLAGIAVLQSDCERVVGRISVCSRLRSSFRAPLFWKGCVRGVGSARWELADLRASIPATLRHAPSRVGRRRCYLGLTPPQPWLLFQAEAGRAHICRPVCALCALVSEIAIAQPSLALPKCPRTTKTTALLGRPYPFKWRG